MRASFRITWDQFVLEDAVRYDLQTAGDYLLVTQNAGEALCFLDPGLVVPAGPRPGFSTSGIAYETPRWAMELFSFCWTLGLRGTNLDLAGVFRRALRDPLWRDALLTVCAVEGGYRDVLRVVHAWLRANPPGEVPPEPRVRPPP